MNNDNFYIPIYHHRLRADGKVRAMSKAERWCYLLLCFTAWDENPAGTLPNCDAFLAANCELTLEEFAASKESIMAPFKYKKRSKRWEHDFLKEIHQLVASKRKRQSDKGKHAAKARWAEHTSKHIPGNAQASAPADAQAMQLNQSKSTVHTQRLWGDAICPTLAEWLSACDLQAVPSWWAEKMWHRAERMQWKGIPAWHKHVAEIRHWWITNGSPAVPPMQRNGAAPRAGGGGSTSPGSRAFVLRQKIEALKEVIKDHVANPSSLAWEQHHTKKEGDEFDRLEKELAAAKREMARSEVPA